MRDVIVYVDGACSGNPGPGGYAAILLHNNTCREITGGFALTTNSRMEIVAVIEALSALKEPCRVMVYSDSQYVVNAINLGWLESWVRSGWQKKTRGRVENIDLWKRLLPLLDRHEVTMVWLRGHSNHPLNERCNLLAQRETRKPNLPDDEGYIGKFKTGRRDRPSHPFLGKADQSDAD